MKQLKMLPILSSSHTRRESSNCSCMESRFHRIVCAQTLLNTDWIYCLESGLGIKVCCDRQLDFHPPNNILTLSQWSPVSTCFPTKHCCRWQLPLGWIQQTSVLLRSWLWLHLLWSTSNTRIELLQKCEKMRFPRSKSTCLQIDASCIHTAGYSRHGSSGFRVPMIEDCLYWLQCCWYRWIRLEDQEIECWHCFRCCYWRLVRVTLKGNKLLRQIRQESTKHDESDEVNNKISLLSS